MFTVFFWIALALAVFDWVAILRKWDRARWFSKPATLVAIIIWYTQVGKWTGPLATVGVGLLFSLLGDILLMLPPRFFSAGMGAFFLTHLFYIAGFNQLPLVLGWEISLPVLAVAGVFTVYTGRIRTGLLRRGEASMIMPIVLYEVIICLMWLAALTTLMRPGWLFTAAILVSLGGGLFVMSDSLLAYNRFVRRRPLRILDVAVMVTYHLAQILIAGGMLEQFVII